MPITLKHQDGRTPVEFGDIEHVSIEPHLIIAITTEGYEVTMSDDDIETLIAEYIGVEPEEL